LQERDRVGLDLMPVLAGGEPKSVADQMDNAALHNGVGQTFLTTSGSPVTPSQTTNIMCDGGVTRRPVVLRMCIAVLRDATMLWPVTRSREVRREW
jgi:hypothetical protein